MFAIDPRRLLCARPAIYCAAPFYTTSYSQSPYRRCYTSFPPSSPSISFMAAEPQIASGQDRAQIIPALETLTAKPDGLWSLSAPGSGVEREFRFRNFNLAWAFMDKVAEKCKAENHHPSWSNEYNTVHILWTTHRPQGLTGKDIKMAKICDEIERETLEADAKKRAEKAAKE